MAFARNTHTVTRTPHDCKLVPRHNYTFTRSHHYTIIRWRHTANTRMYDCINTRACGHNASDSQARTRADGHRRMRRQCGLIGLWCSNNITLPCKCTSVRLHKCVLLCTATIPRLSTATTVRWPASTVWRCYDDAMSGSLNATAILTHECTMIIWYPFTVRLNTQCAVTSLHHCMNINIVRIYGFSIYERSARFMDSGAVIGLCSSAVTRIRWHHYTSIPDTVKRIR